MISTCRIVFGKWSGAAAVFLFLVTATTTILAADPVAVFHVGNSLTDQAYGMHDIAAARGQATKFGRHMIPGAPLQWLWEHREEGFRQPDAKMSAEEIPPLYAAEFQVRCYKQAATYCLARGARHPARRQLAESETGRAFHRGVLSAGIGDATAERSVLHGGLGRGRRIG